MALGSVSHDVDGVLSFCRDESAAASFQRVPKRGGKEVELEDQWIKYLLHEAPKAYVDPVGNAEQEFPFRNKQVSTKVI